MSRAASALADLISLLDAPLPVRRIRETQLRAAIDLLRELSSGNMNNNSANGA